MQQTTAIEQDRYVIHTAVQTEERPGHTLIKLRSSYTDKIKKTGMTKEEFEKRTRRETYIPIPTEATVMAMMDEPEFLPMLRSLLSPALQVAFSRYCAKNPNALSVPADIFSPASLVDALYVREELSYAAIFDSFVLPFVLDIQESRYPDDKEKQNKAVSYFRDMFCKLNAKKGNPYGAGEIAHMKKILQECFPLSEETEEPETEEGKRVHTRFNELLGKTATVPDEFSL